MFDLNGIFVDIISAEIIFHSQLQQQRYLEMSNVNRTITDRWF